ncbi:MAG: PEP-CTERM system TPR-repeat protein PrsT [Desulfuromonadales bacterium]|nr:MAG: PEP-CTERM system TPR-repeat protein PrsT [Desulfuromonadales bacterium]
MLLFIAATLSACGGKTKEELYAEAVKELEKGNANGAIVLLKNAVEKDQNYFDGRYKLAKAYMQVGKFEQAEKELQKALRQDPSHTEIRLELSKIYNSLNKPDMAISEAQEYLKSKPASPDALEVLAVSYIMKKMIPEGEKFLKEVLQQEAERSSAKLQLARLYLASNRVAEGNEILDDIIRKDSKNTAAYYLLASFASSKGNREKEMEYYQKIYEVNPTDVNAAFRVGIMYLGKGELEKAHGIAGDLIGKFPKRAEGRRLKGMYLYTKKDYDQAITEFQSSLKLQQNPGTYYYLGLSYYKRNELENALSQFRKALDLAPSHHQARLLTSLVLLQQKRVDDAIAEAKRVIEADDRNPVAHNILGNAYIAKGMVDEGLKEFNRALELEPRFLDAHVKKGIVSLARGKTAEGEAELETAVKVAPEVLNSRYLLATYYMRTNRKDKAIAVLKEGLRGSKQDALLYNSMAATAFAAKREGEGVSYLHKAREIAPDYFPAYFNLASYYISKKDNARAAELFYEVLKRDGANLQALIGLGAIREAEGNTQDALAFYTKAKDTKKPLGYLSLASYHFRRKEPTKALAIADEALKTNPGNAGLLELKGGLLVADKKYNEALKVYDELEKVAPVRAIPLKIETYVAAKETGKAIEQAQKLVSAQPKSAAGHLVISSIYESQNDIDRAISAVKSGLEVEPLNLQAIMTLGSLYVKKHDFGQAIATYDGVLKKNPKFVPALFAKGAAYDQMGKKKEAVVFYQQALKQQPDNVLTLNNLAFLYADGFGSKSEAVVLADKAFRLQPNNPSIMDTYGYTLLKSGKKGEALKLFEKAASLLPNNPSIHYHLGLAYRESGDKTKAVASVQKSLQLGDFPEAPAARTLLVELKK